MAKLRRSALGCLVAGSLTLGIVAAGSSAQAAVDNSIVLVSVASPEAFGTSNGSYTQGVSDDGRYVAFASEQPNLVVTDQADGIGRYVYLRDLTAEVTTRVSHGDQGYLLGNAAISGDGRYVVYGSYERPDKPSALRLFDQTTGTTKIISTPAAADHKGVDWFTVGISDNGRYVVYTRTTTSDGSTFETRLYRYDGRTGATQRVVKGRLGGSVDAPNNAAIPSVSASGRFIVFIRATQPTERLTPFRMVRIDMRDKSRQTIATSAPAYFYADAFSDPSVSNRGRFIAFSAANHAGGYGAYVYDSKSGSTDLVSHTAEGGMANGDSGHAQISGNGRFVTFSSSATDIVDGVPAVTTVYVYDRATDSATAIVRNRQGRYPAGAGAGSGLPFVDRNADTVAFTSTAQNLASGTGNRLQRVFAWQAP